MKVAEWGEVPYIFHDKEKLPGFVSYLADIWKNRVLYNEDLQEEVLEEEKQERTIHQQRFFDILFDGRMYARNYVGVVQYEGIKIEVYPKIFKEDQTLLNKWHLNLLYWLRYSNKFRFPFSLSGLSTMPFDDLLEFLIYIFANYTQEILSQQPFQAYQAIEEETPFLKGRLLFNDYIRNNIITGQWQRFTCEHEPFIHDNLFNRIVKCVTKNLAKISTNETNKRKLDELIFLLDDVSDVSCSAHDCNKIKLNPLYEEHVNILSLCKLYLSNQVHDIRDEDNKNFCFLIPMECVFEEFIFGFIEDKWPSLNALSQSQQSLTAGKEFWIRNDIYIENQLIIDTKYKIRETGVDSKAGVIHADLYQMISYAVARNCHHVLLLYPAITQNSKEGSFQVPSKMLRENVNIQVRDINITFQELDKADQLIADRIKELWPLFRKDCT